MTEAGDWDVLLIGGGGAVGKTLVARRLARRLAINLLQADDVRLVLQRAVPSTTEPALHFFLTRDIERVELPEALSAQDVIGRYVSHKLEVVVAHHVATHSRLIIEGDAIVPELAATHGHAGDDTRGRVRAAFIEEPDLDSVSRALTQRGRGDASEPSQRRWAAFHHAHGELLAERARELGIPVIPARPWSSLPARVTRAAGL